MGAKRVRLIHSNLVLLFNTLTFTATREPFTSQIDGVGGTLQSLFLCSGGGADGADGVFGVTNRKFEFRARGAKTYTWKKRVSGHSALYNWENGKLRRIATFIQAWEPDVFLHTGSNPSSIVLSEVGSILDEVLATAIYVRRRYETWSIDRKARDSSRSVHKEKEVEKSRFGGMDGDDSSDGDSDGETRFIANDNGETATFLVKP
ncbi:hypothetical protein V5O48_012766 [Marasmius crinis-equi]|uniref:DUF6593 domain-containing protein n=1 Tax=Marasmius crinis-equi TaxID=585013 RepID=A0ABR3F264_9AGAR